MTAIKIGFVLLSNRAKPIASTRISVLNMLEFLRNSGHEPTIFFEPSHADETPKLDGLAAQAKTAGVPVVYFQKVHGPSAVHEARRLHEYGIKTIFGVCDLVDNEMADATDVTITVTDYLKSLYDPRHHHKIFVVHDGIERPEVRKTCYRNGRATSRSPLRAILVTSSELDEIPVVGRLPSFVRPTIVGRYPPAETPWQGIRSASWKLLQKSTLHERFVFLKRQLGMGVDTINWSADTVYEHMRNSDVGIIAIDTRYDPIPSATVSHWQVKSENRLTMKMALGLPVIATSIPAYEGIIEHERNGFFAESRRDWLECFKTLRDPRKVRDIGGNARDAVLPRFSKEEQARKLIAILDQIGTFST